MESPFWPVCRSEAYHFLLIELALVPSPWLCHLKPVCLRADGITPLTQGQNYANRPNWKTLDPHGEGQEAVAFPNARTAHLF